MFLAISNYFYNILVFLEVIFIFSNKVGKIKAVAIIITKTNVEGMTTNMVNIVEVVDMEALEAVEDTKEDMATVVVTKAEEEEGEVITLLIIDVINTNDRCCTDRFIFFKKGPDLNF